MAVTATRFLIFAVVSWVLLFIASTLSLFQQTIFCREELNLSLLTIVGFGNDLVRKS
jgi:hypothetical protein